VQNIAMHPSVSQIENLGRANDCMGGGEQNIAKPEHKRLDPSGLFD